MKALLPKGMWELSEPERASIYSSISMLASVKAYTWILIHLEHGLGVLGEIVPREWAPC